LHIGNDTAGNTRSHCLGSTIKVVDGGKQTIVISSEDRIAFTVRAAMAVAASFPPAANALAKMLAIVHFPTRYHSR
jgi:hypothetical protein